jgi:hypothetical protein
MNKLQFDTKTLKWFDYLKFQSEDGLITKITFFDSFGPEIIITKDSPKYYNKDYIQVDKKDSYYDCELISELDILKEDTIKGFESIGAKIV